MAGSLIVGYAISFGGYPVPGNPTVVLVYSLYVALALLLVVLGFFL